MVMSVIRWSFAGELLPTVGLVVRQITPKHGSWLNMTEIEFSILSRQALDQHISDIATLKCVVDAWQSQRNADHMTIQWCFTPEFAR